MGLRSALISLVSLLTLASLAGCSASAAAERQMEDFRKEIAKFQADNDRLNERVTALEQNGSSTRPASSTAKDPTGESPRLPVVKLAPGQDPDAPPGGDPAAEAPGVEGEEPTVIRAEGSRQQVIKSGKARESSREAQKEYEAAYSLVRRKQYDRALESLSSFLVRHPGDDNADNAMYWRGECFFAKGEYTRAAEEFSGLIARFPQGNKVPDALLKLGLSQQKAGEKEKAKETFARLRNDFPSSDAVRKIPRD